MKVFIVSMRNLILGGIVFLIVLVAGIVLLVKDPLNVSDSYRPGAESITASALPVETPGGAEKPSLYLDVSVDGTTADVSLLTQNFEFVEDDMAIPIYGQGHAHLYLNGEEKGMIYQPEFLLKNLPKGEHELRVELNYSNHLPYKIEAVKYFVVE
ncbi:hypothetical protein ACAF76_011685 [Brevibacillus sp. TJ4]|uniref:hypothetical protein n=1 Tax=Brevibacillus sp. TJ4 TaxID=3234853 RepID=UPI0037D6DFC9